MYLQNLNLGNITSVQGIIITGAKAGDQSGYLVSKIGDINKDGYSDIAIAASNANGGAGIVYVIFGSESSISNIDLGIIRPPKGIVITAPAGQLTTTISVSNIGDFNKDGYDDFIIGVPNINLSAGLSYVIFGKSNINSSNINLNDYNDGGFRIFGVNNNYQCGYSVSGAGDVNGDTYYDLIIGCPGANPNNNNPSAGASFVIFGHSGNVTSFVSIYLSNILSGTAPNQGFAVIGIQTTVQSGNLATGQVGWSVSGAGDINSDGKDDILIGTNGRYYGETFLLLGKSSFSNINVNDITPPHGFFLNNACFGDYTGYSVSGLGDINGDKFGDFITGGYGGTCDQNRYTGASHIYFGSTSLPNKNTEQNVATLMTLAGANAGDWSGYSVSGAGDINGDGYDDVIIGSPYANNGANVGTAYVYFGKPGKSSDFTNIKLSSITPPSQGFIITGANRGDYAGWSVSGAGDFNGDGYSDIIIGAKGAQSSAGASYIIFGGSITPKPTSMPTVNPTLIPTLSPSLTPTTIPSLTPTIVPTVAPTLIPTTALTITITTSGTYAGTPSNDQFTIDASATTTITGNGGSDTFVIKSRNGATLVITDFETDDVIDLTELTSVNKNNIDVKTDTTAIYINLPNDQTIKLADTTNINIKDYISYSITINNNEKTKSGLSISAISGVAASIFSLVGIGGVVWFSQKICKNAFDYWSNSGELLPGYNLKNIILYPCKIHKAHYQEYKIDEIKREKEFEELKKQQTSEASDSNVLSIRNIKRTTMSRVAPLQESDSEIQDIESPSLSNVQHKAVLLCIDALMNPEDVRLQEEEFTRFSQNLMLVYKNWNYLLQGKQDSSPKLLDYTCEETCILAPSPSQTYSDNKNKPLALNDFTSQLLNVRNAIEYIPIVKHFSQDIVYPLIENYLPASVKNISSSEILDSKTFLFTAHLGLGNLGAILLPAELINKGLVTSTAGSIAFGVRLTASHYLNKYRQELTLMQEPIDMSEVIKHCAATVFAYAVPALATCALAQFIMPGYPCNELDLSIKLSFAGAECYSVYKASQMPTIQTTTDTVVPYIADGIAAVASYASGYSPITIVASVVTTDWMNFVA